MRASRTDYRTPFWKTPIFAICAVVGVVVAIFAALLVAAASSPSAPASAYANYGQYVGSSFRCYYVQSPAEVTTDIALGYCPRNSVAYAVPLGWEESHWYIYDSDTYINRVIPVGYRSSYRSSYVVNFSRTYSSSINSYSSNKGTYGYTAPKTVTTRGGGSLRGSCSESMSTVQLKGGSGTGSGSGSSSGSRGGGSLRGGTSGGTTSRTGTTSGSHC